MLYHKNRFIVFYSILLLFILSCGISSRNNNTAPYCIDLTVESTTIHQPNTPAVIRINLAAALDSLGVAGRPDAASIIVEGLNAHGGYEPVDYRLGEGFKTGPSGKIYWNIQHPEMTEYRIRFNIVGEKPHLPRTIQPAIGVGDEIMFNTGEPFRVVMLTAGLFNDWNDDGITDLLHINHYSDRFGRPYDGILMKPGINGKGPNSTDNNDNIIVRGYIPIRYLPKTSTTDSLVVLHARYNWVWPVDWDNDGHQDLLYFTMKQQEAHQKTMPENVNLRPAWHEILFLKNTGEKDWSGLPVLHEAAGYPSAMVTEGAYVVSVEAHDLNGDGARDIIALRTTSDGSFRIVTCYWYENTGSDDNGIPILAEPVILETTDGSVMKGLTTAFHTSFGDVNDDGRIDMVCNDGGVTPPTVFWYENLGGTPPVFERRGEITGLPYDHRGYRWDSWDDNNTEGLFGKGMAQLNERTQGQPQPSFTNTGMVQEVWGPMRGGTQEKPEWVDWDADGDQDLVSGESYGRIHIYENVGNDGYHAFKAPVKLRLANGEIFHITRDKVFGGEHWHGEMGYPSVACVDWDDDGLFDLIIPNETNRVYWMKNIGTATEPAFQFMRQILPDGFSDSPERLEKTRELYNTEGVEKLPYPYEDDIPFYWRTRLALDDFTGDGLIDIVALNGNKYLVLYRRYRDNDGNLRLDNGTQIYFDNGDPIKNPHWMKARNVDWNNDGLVDLVTTQNLFGPDQRSLLYYENVGTAETPVFKEPVGLSFWGETIRYSSHGLQPSFVDWDYDGALDFVGSNESGYFVLFRNAALKHGRPEVTTTRYSLITH